MNQKEKHEQELRDISVQIKILELVKNEIQARLEEMGVPHVFQANTVGNYKDCRQIVERQIQVLKNYEKCVGNRLSLLFEDQCAEKLEELIEPKLRPIVEKKFIKTFKKKYPHVVSYVNNETMELSRIIQRFIGSLISDLELWIGDVESIELMEDNLLPNFSADVIRDFMKSLEELLEENQNGLVVHLSYQDVIDIIKELIEEQHEIIFYSGVSLSYEQDKFWINFEQESEDER